MRACVVWVAGQCGPRVRVQRGRPSQKKKSEREHSQFLSVPPIRFFFCSVPTRARARAPRPHTRHQHTQAHAGQLPPPAAADAGAV